MNELRPLICRSDPVGSGGAGCAGGGKRKVARAPATALEGPDSRWPISALAPAIPTATEPVIRNARRPGRDAGAAARGGGPDGTQDAPVSGPSPAAAAATVAPGGRLAVCGRSGGPGGSPGVAAGDGAESARSVADAAFTSRDMVYAPAAPPSRTGSTSIAPESGRVSAASSPMAVNTASPASPKASRWRAATPIRAANTARTTRMPVTRTRLSLEPKAEMAKFFTGAGVLSMAAPPTATTGANCGPVNPATSWATPIATKAVIRPVATPRPRCAQPDAPPPPSGDDVTPAIRSRCRSGLPE